MTVDQRHLGLSVSPGSNPVFLNVSLPFSIANLTMEQMKTTSFSWKTSDLLKPATSSQRRSTLILLRGTPAHLKANCEEVGTSSNDPHYFWELHPFITRSFEKRQMDSVSMQRKRLRLACRCWCCS